MAREERKEGGKGPRMRNEAEDPSLAISRIDAEQSLSCLDVVELSLGRASPSAAAGLSNQRI